MTPGTAGRGAGIAHGITAAGMTGAGMAVIAIIHGPIGDVLGVATGVATMDGIITIGMTGMVVDIMDITTIAVTTAVVQA